MEPLLVLAVGMTAIPILFRSCKWHSVTVEESNDHSHHPLEATVSVVVLPQAFVVEIMVVPGLVAYRGICDATRVNVVSDMTAP